MSEPASLATAAYRYDRRSAVGWILSHMRRYAHYAVVFLLGTVLWSGMTALLSLVIGSAFDAIGRPDAAAQLGALALGLLAVILAQGAIDIAKSSAVEVLGNRMARDARDELFLSLLGKSQTFHSRQRVGDLAARITGDIQLFRSMLNPGLDLSVNALISLILPLLFIGAIRLDLLLTPLIFLVLFGLALVHFAVRLGPIADRMRDHYGVMHADLTETIAGIELVQSVAGEEAARHSFDRNARTYRDLFVEQGLVQATYLPPLLLTLAVIGAFVHGLLLVIQGQITVGTLVTYIGLVQMLRFPTTSPLYAVVLLQLGVSAAGRMLEVLNDETTLAEPTDGHAAPIRGDVVFEQVSLRFGEREVLHDISFRAAVGQTVAIVGQVSAGKSSVAKLINRTYDVNAGRVLIDGVDVLQWDIQALRSQIASIEQDVFLFTRSIADNIAFGCGRAVDQAAIERAARQAQAHDFIGAMRDGYATPVGERGVTLSGGQRQRIAIARALLTDPRILIVDDSTSAIDSATEDQIQQALQALMQGRTTILITHRLAHIRRADHILLLQGGELVDQGSHDELFGRCELYRSMYAPYDSAPADWNPVAHGAHP